MTNAVHLGAQLPVLLRGVYYEGWRPHEPAPEDGVSFLDRVQLGLRRSMDITAMEASRASFIALTECIDDDEIKKLMRMTPLETWLLWPAALEEAVALGTH